MTGPISRIVSPNLPMAACANNDVNPEWFYAADQVQPNAFEVMRARSLCVICLEQKKCLEWGLENEDFGVWGGLTANERIAYKKNQTKRLKIAEGMGLI